ncbi:dicer-like protein 4 isoform X2 [Euphorbia lathyris]|uniref:dicer-like protein 4 isoform X2 n=1 Tax=Euphorbia lathyris TaxID=212925 RepID=UPI003313E88B
MPHGEVTREADIPLGDATNASTAFGVLDDGEKSVFRPQQPEKDPRKIARKYQLELCKKALEENIIVYLGTGCGKTHIAVLLMYELGHLIRSPQKSICVFLAPTTALVHQQAQVIEESINFKVGICCGNSKHLKSHDDWEREIKQYEVFYKSNDGKLPRIFGMTASPIVGKGASDQANLSKSINSLENLLDAKVYSVEDNAELEYFVASPVVKIYTYSPATNGTSSSYMTCCNKLTGIKHMCISEVHKKIDDCQSLRNTKKVLNRIHANVIFCLENLGIWGGLQACQILLNRDQSEWSALVEAEGNISDDSICDKYLSRAANVFATLCMTDGISFDLSCLEVLNEPFFSRKLLCLIRILSSFRLQPNRKCIIFVNRIVTARCLSYVLQNLKFLTSWKCDFLVGVHSGGKSMSRKNVNKIVEKFRTGTLNLLIATKVGEEGLDIQTCCLVIRFDLPETVASFIQSRGRARMPQSEYAFLVDSGNQKELGFIENFRKDEARMNVEISSRTSDEGFVDLEEKVYKVDISGASVSSAYSVSLLHHYCSKLPHDEYFDPKPFYFYQDDLRGTICRIVLPANAPLHVIVSTPQSSLEAAKKDACLKAIEQLHKTGALSNFLLPTKEDADEEPESDPCDSEDSEAEGSRGELHEMLVPAILKESFTIWKNSVCLNSYYIQFSPVPEDRIYKKFGLFVKAPLPLEAEQMELELHLAHGRYVKTKLFQSGPLEFTADEIIQARKFQEMFLKVILDRSEMVPEYVPLGKNCSYKSSPTLYLLLPILHDSGNKVTVNWEIVRRCISSPVFTRMENGCIPSGPHLQLANGCRSTSDIENSLVYVPHKKQFYFIVNIVHGKDANLPHKDSGGPSHVQHLLEAFGIELKYPEQCLLHAKPLFHMRNLLHDRRKENIVTEELDEYFIDLPPELCELKIIGFSKDIGSSISLLPSVMHRLENLLVAIELKSTLSVSFPEGVEVTAYGVLEALTTERCQERLSLERLEILGDAFLKYSVGRRLFLLHDTLDEGELTRRRSNVVNNSNLFKLASTKKLQVYIRDQPFDPAQFFALGRPCPKICTKESEWSVHYQNGSHAAGQGNANEVRCSRGHHWLHKKTIADVVEALIGAFIVDSGFKAAAAFLKWLGISVDFESSEVMNIYLASSRFTSRAPSMDISSLESSLGHQFLNKGLLLQAFVHPSYNKHEGGCYQRLEFLGDAVLDYLITSYLFSVYPKLKPGHLTDLRSALVNNRAFASVSIDRSFHKFIICDSSKLSEAIKNYENSFKGLASDRGLLEGPKCPKVLGDLVESCLGATLLDTGFNLNYIWKLMISFLGPLLNSPNVQLSPFRELRELCQSRNWDLQYPTLLKERIFLVEAKVNGEDVCLSASASNPNKKEAIRNASEQIFVKLKDKGYIPKSNYLEKVLKTTQKMEPKLIGYDETPVDFSASLATELERLKIKEPGCSNINPIISKLKETEFSYLNPKITRLSVAVASKQPHSPSQVVGQSSETTSSSKSETLTTDGSYQRSAKSRLYEACAANCWKPPSFECCSEEGPGHLKNFTFKVVMEIEAPEMIIECYGEARSKKKSAADHAAEGALWYLRHQGYLN